MTAVSRLFADSIPANFRRFADILPLHRWPVMRQIRSGIF
jgi:hypothetical protein